MISFAGVPCESCSATRSTGIDPDFMSVVLSHENMTQLLRLNPSVRITSLLFGDTAGDKTVNRNEDRLENEEPSALSQLKADSEDIRFGSLVIDGASWSVNGRVEIGPLFLREGGITPLDPTYTATIQGSLGRGPGHVRADLADIRYFWRLRGNLWGSYNLRHPSSGSYYTATLDPLPAARKPYSVWRLLSLILDALPGSPFLITADPAVELRLKEAVQDNVRWEGEAPVEVLGDFIRRYALELHLSLDGQTITFTEALETNANAAWNSWAGDVLGRQGSIAVGGVSIPPDRCDFSPRKGPRYPPTLVRVMGDSIIRETVLPLRPVGVHKTTRRVVPLADAAKSWGVTVAQLGQWLLLDSAAQETAFDGFASGRAQDIRGWAFRSYQLHPQDWSLLPVLDRVVVLPEDRRGVSPDDPLDKETERRPEALADTYEIMLLLPKHTAKYEQVKAGYEAELAAECKPLLTEIAGLRNQVDDISKTEPKSSQDIKDKEAERMKLRRKMWLKIRELQAAQKRLKDKWLPLLAKEVTPGGSQTTAGTTRFAGDVSGVAEQLLSALDEQTRKQAQLIVVNSMLETSDFSLNAERGIVTFDEPVGVLFALNQPSVGAIAGEHPVDLTPLVPQQAPPEFHRTPKTGPRNP